MDSKDVKKAMLKVLPQDAEETLSSGPQGLINAAKMAKAEENVKALQSALADNKAMQTRLKDLMEENKHLKELLSNVPSEGGIVSIGHSVPNELAICERQIQLMKEKSDSTMLEWDDVKVLASLVESKLKVLNNTLDLKKPSKKDVQAEMTDVEILSLLSAPAKK